jgi:RHS repeat-associated protein
MRRSLRSALAAWLVALSGMAFAQEVNVSYLQGLLPKAETAITTLGPDLMGDRVNLFNGALEFEHTDVSIPGNSALPVSLTRRHVAGRTVFIRGVFGDWDLETPRVSGVFAGSTGWVNGANEVSRCSSYSAPPVQYRASSGGGGGGGALAAPAPGGSASGSTGRQPAAGAAAVTSVTFFPADYWQGNFLHVPGAGGQEVFVRPAADSFVPTDGNSYHLVTKGKWHLRCLSTIQNAAGEGFIAISPEGVTYRFDWMASRFQPAAKREGASLGRREYMLMATQVTDRFGNWVTYTYSAAAPERLTSVQSNDGRQITLSYDTSGRVASASDGSRTWTYGYNTTAELATVTRPDASRWSFNLRPLVHLNSFELGELASCESPGYFPESPYTGTITHPSGAVGTFNLQFTGFNRSNVTKQCVFVGTKPVSARWPKSTISQALVGKSIGGPGIPVGGWTWTYTYSGGAASWAPCSPCADTRMVEVRDPSGVKTRHTFGVRYQSSEGQLLAKEEGVPSTGGAGLRNTSYRYRQNGPWPEPLGISINQNSDYLATRHRPEDQRVISQQASTFTWEAAAGNLGFDTKARVIEVRRFSSLGPTRTDRTTYEDNTTRWVIGQLQTLTETTTGLVAERNDYEPGTAMRSAKWAFGRLLESYSYNPDGTLFKRFDPLNRATTFSNYYRGIPRLVTGRDGYAESAVVNALGQITTYTNEAGTSTFYGYDAMGRLASVGFPTESWGSYFPTIIAFEPVATSEYGLGSGHWRQTISTGNARTVRYFDALWNLRLAVRYDASDQTNTSSFVESRYDFESHKTFESYPTRGFGAIDGPIAGRRWQYDGLDRVIRAEQDSELGVLATVTAYPAGAFQKIVTNPRGYSSTYSFQAFDTPSEDSIVWISAPHGVSISFARDVFGKAGSIMRSGPYAGSTQSASRAYIYDAHQRLCKTIEPETGANIQAYDGAGNVAWRASGQALPGFGSCDQGSVPAAARVSYGYDAEDRLINTSYGDGAPGIGRSYTADGLLYQMWSDNSIWTYGYNNRRLPTSESLSLLGSTRWLMWGIDAHGNRASLADPDGTLQYSPNALGQPTQISGFASSVRFHPNGALAGYTAANGVVFSSTLNARNLPDTWRHTTPNNGSLVNDTLTYDANGNVMSITDPLGAPSRTMGPYDGLDRLTSVNGSWGAATFDYDALDNLRSSTVGSRSTVSSIDQATNRLTQLTINGQATAIGYDANGNIRTKGAQGYVFDVGNRMRGATGIASYAYDGHGRRAWTNFNNLRTRWQMYSTAGKLHYTADSLRGATRYIYLGERLIAESNSQIGTTWTHTDYLGSPVVRSSSTGMMVDGSRTGYEPYGGTVAGSSNPDGIGYTGHVNDPDTGLVYMQQRYYDPFAGRFLSVDPVVTDAKTGDHFNRYEYANSNPYKFKDPDGRAPQLIEESKYAGRPMVGMGQTNADGGPVRLGTRAERIEALQASREARGLQGPPGPAVDKATGQTVGRVVVDSKGNAMIEPAGGKTVPAGKGGVDTHTLNPNGSNYQRLNPQGHGNNPTPHGHGHLPGSGPGKAGQGPSIDPKGNVVPANSPAAHWPIKEK